MSTIQLLIVCATAIIITVSLGAAIETVSRNLRDAIRDAAEKLRR